MDDGFVGGTNQYYDYNVWPVRKFDTTKPIISVSSKPINYSNKSSDTIHISSNEVVTFECNIDNDIYSTCTSSYSYSSLSSGQHTFSAKGTDLAGNVSLPVSFVWNVDTTRAASSSILLQRTGQTTCFDAVGTVISCSGTGQDGEIQAGSVLSGSRFTDNGDQTITDSQSGLIWTKDANVMVTRDPLFDADVIPDGKVEWQHALDYVKKLNTENYLGSSNWRLPNINELKSLININQRNQATWLSSLGFINNILGDYWSSTTDTYGFNSALGVGFHNGFIGGISKSGLASVRAVRSSTNILSLPKTGQTLCSVTLGSCTGSGQDGESQAGVAWPSQRFTGKTDQTITDNLTGLVWSKNANLVSGVLNWQQSLDYVKGLNNSNWLGHNDWRLSNREELASLINYGETNTASWLIAQGFTGVQFYYRSSSTDAANPSNAWDIYFDSGSIVSNLKSNSSYFWPVRGGVNNIPKYGLVASLPFNGNTLDVSGNGNNGSASGATLTAGNLGDLNGAYNFNGASDYISLGNTLGNFAADYTLSFWIKTNATPVNLMEIMNTRSGVGTGNWLHIRMTSSGTLFSELGTTQNFITTIPINDGQFHMVTYSRKGSITSIFIDGNLDTTDSISPHLAERSCIIEKPIYFILF